MQKKVWMVTMKNYTYFDLLSHFGIGGAHPGGIILTKELLSAENIDANSKVLDAGCGTGQTSAYLYEEFGPKILALDINPIMLEKAKERFNSHGFPIDIVNASIENIPIDDQTFDIVLSESVLVFVQNKKALQEFYRVLKKGGRLIANEMTMNYHIDPQEEEEIKKFYKVDSLLFEEDWIQLLKDTGFTNIEIKSKEKSMLDFNLVPEFNFSENFEPELFFVLNKHSEMLIKYNETLSFRAFTCTKE